MYDKKDEVEASSWKSNIALGIIGTSFVGTVLLISPFVTMQLRSPLPYMATPRKKVLDALDNIAKMKLKEKSISQPKKLRYYDLGSGDGETVLAASSLGWKATGIELNRTLWALSSLRRLVTSHQIRRQSNFIWGNMWEHSIHDADAVMVFGVKPLMPKIANKIKNECQPGTFVLSYRFLIPCTEGIHDQINDERSIQNVHQTKICKSDENDTEESYLDATLVYDKDEMRVYQLCS